MKRRLHQIVSGTLIWILSGASQLIPHASANPEQLQALRAQATTLEQQYQTLVRRARYPGTPGTPAGIPSASDLSRAEQSLTQLRATLQSLLSSPNAPQSGNSSQNYIPVDAKLPLLDLYFNLLSALTTLRIALHLPHTPEWRSQFSLRLPRAIMVDFPGLGASAQNRLGDRYLPLTVDRGTDGRADPVELRLSESLVQGLEIGALTDAPNDANHLTLVQYLAVRQLSQNLNDLALVAGEREPRMPEIPQPLRSRVESMGLSQTVLQEQRVAVSEPAARNAILSTFASIKAQLPSFVSDTYVRALAKIIAENRRMERDLLAPLRQTLSDAERENITAAIEHEISASNLMLGALPETELELTLRFIVSNAFAGTHLNKIISLIGDGILNLPIEKSTRVTAEIEARKKAFSDEVAASVITSWRAAARADHRSQLFTQRRQDFIENLMLRSFEINSESRSLFSGSTVDPSALMRAFAPELAVLAPRESVKGWIQEIAQAGTYAAARDTYTRRIVDLTAPRVLADGLVDPALTLNYLEHHNFAPELGFTNRRLREELVKRLEDGRKKDIRDLVQVGTWLGFHLPRIQSQPRLQEVLASSKQADYYSAVETRVFNDYPILAQTVSVVTPTGGTTEKKLYEALAAANPQHHSSREVIERASPLVDAALAQAEARCRELITRVASARNLQQVQSILESSMMLELVLGGFPEFRIQQTQFLESILNPSLTQQIMHRHVGWYLSAGFGALLLMHVTSKVAKRTAPWVEVITTGLSPWIQGYMKSAMLLMIADTLYQGNEVLHARERARSAEELYATGTTGRGFIDYSELSAMQGSYAWTRNFFIGRLAMDTVFMYIPMGRQLITKLGNRMVLREFMADVSSFRALGLEPGSWNHLESGIATARASHAEGSQARAAAETSYRRLHAKMTSGDIWDLEQIRAEKPTSRTDERIRRALVSQNEH